MNAPATEKVFAIERPHANLIKLYLIRSIISGPLIFLSLPILYFRYHTLRYKFDEEGITMSWGLLFRREINLTYNRIQDIHKHSGIIQRWLGLADLKIQTASGSAEAEMTIEGLLEYDMVRDFIYGRMRGYMEEAPASGQKTSGPENSGNEMVNLLRQMAEDVRATRKSLESVCKKEV